MKKIYYAIEHTKPNAKIARYSLYELKGKDLQVVWKFPEDEKAMLPYQVKSKNPKYPYIHFKIPDVNYSRLEELARSLKAEIRFLNGWSPSTYGL